MDLELAWVRYPAVNSQSTVNQQSKPTVLSVPALITYALPFMARNDPEPPEYPSR